MKEFARLVFGSFIRSNGGNIRQTEFMRKYNLYNYKLPITPRRALAIAKALDDPEFGAIVKNLVDAAIYKKSDFIQCAIVASTQIGSLPVYDLAVEDNHSFISNFVHVHNTIAGSLIFTVFDREVMEELIALYPDDTLDNDYSTLMIDQIPPFDITIQFVNEDGYLSSMVIYGVDIVDDGQVMSINDMIIENVKSFKARAIDLMYRKSAGVWTPARKVDPFARFEGLNPRKEKDTTSQYSEELKRILFEIDSATDQIHGFLTENANYEERMGEPGIDDSQMQRNIDANILEIDKLNAKITELTRREREIRISLGFEERRKEIGLGL
jgi:intein/homing endonuclease